MDQITIDIPEGIDPATKAQLAAELRRVAEQIAPTADTPGDRSFYDAAQGTLIGGELIEDGPADLSSNPDHLEGFGR